MTSEKKETPAVRQEAKQQTTTIEKDTDYEKGMEAYKKGEGLDAIKYFNASGSAESFYMMGLIYENGCGSVGKNAMMARKNFKKAAELGNENAKEKL